MVRAVADAPAAVDAELVYDMGFPVMYADRLGRAVLDAVEADSRRRTERMNLLLFKLRSPFL